MKSEKWINGTRVKTRGNLTIKSGAGRAHAEKHAERWPLELWDLTMRIRAADRQRNYERCDGALDLVHVGRVFDVRDTADLTASGAKHCSRRRCIERLRDER